jgi:hypothetical protein
MDYLTLQDVKSAVIKKILKNQIKGNYYKHLLINYKKMARNISDKIKIIHAKGVEELTEKETQLVNRLLNEYYVRIQRQLKNFTSMEFHVKEYEKAGKGRQKMEESEKKKKKKFSIHIRIDANKVFESDYADWDLARAIHKALNKLMNQIEHEFHVSDQHDKFRKPQNVRKRGR